MQHDPRKLKEREYELELLKEKKLCEQSLRTFTKRAWSVIEPGRMYQHNWHIDAICDHLEAVSRREIRNLIINIPPRHMKSTIVTVCWNAWVWGPQRHAWHDWIFGSYHPSLSSRDAVKARRLMRSEWYQKHWGDQFQFLRDQSEKMNFKNSMGGTRTSTTPGGAGTGKGADIIVADDPHKVKGIESIKQREAVFDWWDNEMASRGNDPKTLCKVVIMQRVHELDLCGHLKEKGSYEELVIPFRYDPTIYSYAKSPPRDIKDPRTVDGELLWKNRYDEKSSRALEESLTAYQKTGQLEQRPTPREGDILKRQWFSRRWTTLPGRFDRIIDTWDLTQAGEQGVSKDVGFKLGKVGAIYYVLDRFRDKLDLDGQLDTIPAFKKREKMTKEILIEEAATGKAIHSKLRKTMSGIILIGVTGKGSKEERAIEQSHVFKSGNLLFPADNYAPWVAETLEEIISFGPRAKFKDCVDALVQGIAYWEEGNDDYTFEPVSLTKESGWMD